MISTEKDFDWISRRLIFEEGLRLKPYKDNLGYTTIGVGRCVSRNPFTEKELKALGDWSHGITKNGAMMLLRNDVTRCIFELKNNIPFFPKLGNERQYALLSMCFQLGINGLLKFKKMLSYMSLGNFKNAAIEARNSEWARQTPNRCDRISRLIETGIWKREV